MSTQPAAPAARRRSAVDRLPRRGVMVPLTAVGAVAAIGVGLVAATGAARAGDDTPTTPVAAATSVVDTSYRLGMAVSRSDARTPLGTSTADAAADKAAADAKAKQAAAAAAKKAAADKAAAAKKAQEARQQAALEAARKAQAATEAKQAAAVADARSDPQAVARQLMAEHGWTSDAQFGCLVNLWNGESDWRWSAENSSSGAYGIPQSLPARKMAQFGADYRTNPVTQIKWGLWYIDMSYGSPCNAWSQWQARSPHWY
ncbi:aggregation-promoting factor C-terminal-like domain-containing protein [Terracoccus luteus]|uniref:Transglycosylase-like protein with SLT domain n=1 Tax=Terracoccus luteus TaxID=53356 RepID=A0A839PS51_9MICO|nr:hypothetical protein [Terracoccus luteus]MBB2985624.1 hypothetical protein [Terracoccus luteus]MCP2171276.1 hypothetical protein [Terracoccus luteus]